MLAWDLSVLTSLLDPWLGRAMPPLVCWALLNALDDLVIDLAWLWGWTRERLLRWPKVPYPFEAALDRAPMRRIAIFVPLWQEHAIIQGMIEHNIAALRYPDYEFFIGAYPNDPATVRAIEKLEARFPNVHLALCPHGGPTSKADNLNAIYEAMVQFERKRGQRRFDLVVTHDAEDLMHPESLRWVNYYAQCCDMVQIPVLPLPTPVWHFTHGVYCDEFAEFQSKELPARQLLGGFLPSCGVGTAFSRDIIERCRQLGRTFFDPRCLTEDYENGFRVRRLGGRQVFVPIRHLHGAPVATREYFPRRFRQAVRQRTRWMTGITLQSWELHGWKDTLSQAYWFWRDRKGLLASLAGPLTTVLFGRAVYRWCCAAEGPLWDSSGPAGWMAGAFAFTLGVQLVHVAMRIGFVARVYGPGFALLAPLRLPFGTLINFLAAVSAVARYAAARVRGRRLPWLKTEHSYPGRAALAVHKRRLGEILIEWGYLTAQELEAALTSRPYHLRLGEHLLTLGYVTENQLYRALSHQQGIPLEQVPRRAVSRHAIQALPLEVARRWKVMPFQIEEGHLCLAGPEPPSDAMRAELAKYTSLGLRFHWVTPSAYEELRREFLPSGAAEEVGIR